MDISMVIVLMGVSGCGKTTVGARFARDLGWRFYDGDDFHPPANIEKMSRGIPLTDDDREPWLVSLQQLIGRHLRDREPAVLACSALKGRYRELLLRGNEGARLVYLKGDYDLIWNRMKGRRGHYMKAGLLASQFEALEEPKEALWVDISQGPDAIVAQIRRGLHL